VLPRIVAPVVFAMAALWGASGAAQPRPTTALIETGDAPWPRGAMGQAIGYEQPRPASRGVLRSLRAPVAVHLGPGVSATMAAEVLAVAERVCDRLAWHYLMELPAPDGLRGGGPEFDLYLTLDGPALSVVPEGGELGALWDRASAWGRVRADDPASLPRRVAEAVARAVVYGAKADHPPAAVAAMGASLARLTLDLPSDPEALAAFQAAPHRAILGADREERDWRGAGALFDWWHARYDDPRGTMLRGLLDGAAQRTPLGETTLWDEPDLFDVARRVLRDEAGGFPRALLGFALARSSWGTPGDDLSLTGYQGPALAARPAHVLPWTALPAWRVVTGIEPTGSAVIRVDLSSAPDIFTGDPSVSVYLHGAPWHRWIVGVQRYNALGQAMGLLASEVVTDGFWSTRADALEGVRTLDVVVVSLGGMDFDPDLPIPPRSFFALHVVPATGPPLPR